MELGLMTAGGVTLVILAGLVWLHARQQVAIDRLDDRVAHLLAGVSLLTDTTEGALRDVANEIGRLSAVREREHAAPAARPRATQRTVARAVKRGRTIQDVAAAAQVSEGEVRLRLELEKARKEWMNGHATLR